MNKNENLEQLAEQYTPLIHHVMKSLYLNKSDNHYEDYVQELYIQLFEIAADFDGEPLGKDNFRFTHYAKNGLRWHLIDLLRASKKQKNELPLLDTYFIKDYQSDELEDKRISFKLFFNEVKRQLSSSEFSLFLAIISGDYTLQELASHYGVSRKTIGRRKQHIINKIYNLKQILQ